MAKAQRPQLPFTKIFRLNLPHYQYLPKIRLEIPTPAMLISNQETKNSTTQIREFNQTIMLIEKTEITEKQKAASRANGAKTHGPITPEGKRKSARNSFRHGLLAKAIVFEGESREQFAALLKAFCDELQPQSPIEDLLVQKMAVNQWRQERLWGQEKARASQPRCLPESSPPGSTLQEICQPEPRIATQMNMSEMRYDRQFGRAP